jgi:hypothetical protein
MSKQSEPGPEHVRPARDDLERERRLEAAYKLVTYAALGASVLGDDPQARVYVAVRDELGRRLGIGPAEVPAT